MYTIDWEQDAVLWQGNGEGGREKRDLLLKLFVEISTPTPFFFHAEKTVSQSNRSSKLKINSKKPTVDYNAGICIQSTTDVQFSI